MKKNCINCEHLSYEYGDSSDGHFDEGFTCWKRIETTKNEKKLLKDLDSEKYREKSKRCFEGKIALNK